MEVCLNVELLNMGATVYTCVYMDVGESLCVYACACVCERKLGEGGVEASKGGAPALGRG